MIDKRTRFFAFSSLLAFSMYFVAPDDTLRKVTIAVGIVYIFLMLLCGADSISRFRSKNSS